MPPMTHDSPQTLPLHAPPDFAKALEALESLVQRLERGDLSLEESLSEFERGLALTRQCQHALAIAEQKVRILTEQGAVEFSPDDHPQSGEKA